MAGINLGRVILGGLLAGLIVTIGETVLNVAVAGQAMETALAARNLPPVGGPAIGGFVAPWCPCWLITFAVPASASSRPPPARRYR
jgi:hypothetical protein